MSFFILISIIGFIILLWQNSLSAREVAIRVATQTCKSQNYQFLDGGAMALELFKPTFSFRKGPKIIRRYRFEFSTEGNDRSSGYITLLGMQVDSTVLTKEDEQKS